MRLAEVEGHTLWVPDGVAGDNAVWAAEQVIAHDEYQLWPIVQSGNTPRLIRPGSTPFWP